MSVDTVGNYGWTSADAPESCQYLAPRVLDLLRILNAARILDLGAGNGALCGLIHGDGREVVGMECDHIGLELARARHPDIKFYQYAVNDEPAVLLRDEAPFDAVVSTEVVEHLYAPHQLPIYARAVLKDGGYLVVSTPYHGYFKNLVLSLLDKWDAHHTALWHGGHIKFWSRASLSRLLTENGLRVLSFAGVGRVPYLWKSMILVAQRTT